MPLHCLPFPKHNKHNCPLHSCLQCPVHDMPSSRPFSPLTPSPSLSIQPVPSGPPPPPKPHPITHPGGSSATCGCGTARTAPRPAPAPQQCTACRRRRATSPASMPASWQPGSTVNVFDRSTSQGTDQHLCCLHRTTLLVTAVAMHHDAGGRCKFAFTMVLRRVTSEDVERQQQRSQQQQGLTT
jgi:hypothetical protein